MNQPYVHRKATDDDASIERNYNAKQVHLTFWPRELEVVLQATKLGSDLEQNFFFSCCMLFFKSNPWDKFNLTS